MAHGTTTCNIPRQEATFNVLLLPGQVRKMCLRCSCYNYIWWNRVCVVWHVGDDEYIRYVYTVSIQYDIYLCLKMLSEPATVIMRAMTIFGRWFAMYIYIYNFICHCLTGKGVPSQMISINLMSFIYIHAISSGEGPCPSTPTWNTFYISKSLVAHHNILILLSSMWQELAPTPMSQMHAMLLCSHSRQEWRYRTHDQNHDTKKTS